MTEIPEHLLKRAQIAGQNKHLSSEVVGIEQSEGFTPAALSDVGELAALVDIDSAEACSLGAVAIRHGIGRFLKSEKLSQILKNVLPKRSTRYYDNKFAGGYVIPHWRYGHREVESENGILTVVDKKETEWVFGKQYHPIAGDEFEETNAISLSSWVQGTKRVGVGFLGNKIKYEGIPDANRRAFNIGIFSVMADIAKPLTIPLLRSIKTPQGCYVLYQQDKENDSEMYNNKEVVSRTLNLLDDINDMTVTESLLAVKKIAEVSEDIDFIAKTDSLKMLYSEGQKTTVERKIIDFHFKNNSNYPESIIGHSDVFSHNVAGSEQQFIYELKASSWDYAQNGFLRTNYSIHGMLNPDRYGYDEAVKRRFKRFEISIDELLNVEINSYLSDGETTIPVSEKDKKDIALLLEMIQKNMDTKNQQNQNTETRWAKDQYLTNKALA